MSPPGGVEVVLGVEHSARPQALVLHDLRFKDELLEVWRRPFGRD